MFTVEAEVLKHSAETVLQLRRSVQHGEWRQAEIDVAKAEASVSLLDPSCVPEVHACRMQVDSHRVVEALTLALSTGGASLTADVSLNTAGISIKDLQRAVSMHDGVMTRSEVATSLYDIAKLVIDLRNCVVHSDWLGAAKSVEVCTSS